MEHIHLPLLIALIGLAAVAVVVLLIISKHARLDRPPRKAVRDFPLPTRTPPMPKVQPPRPHVTAISEKRG